MKKWHELELEYAKKLRACPSNERRKMYEEAYRVVSESAMSEMPNEVEKRTAGTSLNLVNLLIRLCHSTDCILEVGCGRGYTCLKLAPHVKSIVGLDVSRPALDEARELIIAKRVNNVSLLLGSADELICHFESRKFDKVISIDVYEHLAPEDAMQHISQVYSILKPKGRLIIVTPNRLTGPHDITRELFPDAQKALGFHLNETTCGGLLGQMKTVGFAKFYSVLPLSFKLRIPLDIIYPADIFVLIEKLFPKVGSNSPFTRFVRMFSSIILIAEKSQQKM